MKIEMPKSMNQCHLKRAALPLGELLPTATPPSFAESVVFHVAPNGWIRRQRLKLRA
jgi:hypothetical protein